MAAKVGMGGGGGGDDGKDGKEEKKLDSIDVGGRSLRYKHDRAKNKYKFGEREGTRSRARARRSRSRSRSGSRERSESPEPQPPCPSRVDGVAVWRGGRLSWKEADKAAWKLAQADAHGNYTCAWEGTARAHANCKGTSNIAGNYEVDHIEDWKNYVVAHTDPQVLCDGTWHWLAYARDDAADAYNDQDNFQLLCDSCNASKGRGGPALDHDPNDKLGACDC